MRLSRNTRASCFSRDLPCVWFEKRFIDSVSQNRKDCESLSRSAWLLLLISRNAVYLSSSRKRCIIIIYHSITKQPYTASHSPLSRTSAAQNQQHNLSHDIARIASSLATASPLTVYPPQLLISFSPRLIRYRKRCILRTKDPRFRAIGKYIYPRPTRDRKKEKATLSAVYVYNTPARN